jgi:hypothetical protein
VRNMQNTSAILMGSQDELTAAIDQSSAPSAAPSGAMTEVAVLAGQTEPSGDGAALPPGLQTAEPAMEQPTVETQRPGRGPGSRTATQRPPTCQMVEVELGEIYDEHALVAEVREESGVVLRELKVRTMTKPGLMSLAGHSPLHVVKKAGKLYCIGGLRFFRLLKYDLPASTQLRVILQEGLSDKKLRIQIYFDLFAMPIIAGVDMRDRRDLGKLLESPQAMELFGHAFGCSDSKGLAKILGCDSRTLGKAERDTHSSETK